MIRSKMNKLIRILEKEDSDALNSVIHDKVYLKALDSLEDQGCVKVIRDMNGTIHNVWLQPHYATYQLSRCDVWLNRLWGFIAGVVTAVAAHYIIVLIELWLSSR